MARLDPLPEDARLVNQVMGKKKSEITEWLEIAKGQLKAPLSEQLVATIQGHNHTVNTVVANCKEEFE